MTDNVPAPTADDGGEFLRYQTDDGTTRIEVQMVPLGAYARLAHGVTSP